MQLRYTYTYRWMCDLPRARRYVGGSYTMREKAGTIAVQRYAPNAS